VASPLGVVVRPGRHDAKPGDGVLECVMPGAMETLLSLTMRFDGREHTGILSPPPPLGAVEKLLKANLGSQIRAIGDLDV
jgi:hypothetical protein